MKVHKILIPLIIALTLVLIQGCAVDDRALDGSKEKSPQLAVNDEVITPDPEDEIIDLNEETLSKTVTLSFNLGSGSNNAGRSMARTAIGTFEEITSLMSTPSDRVRSHSFIQSLVSHYKNKVIQIGLATLMVSSSMKSIPSASLP